MEMIRAGCGSQEVIKLISDEKKKVEPVTQKPDPVIKEEEVVEEEEVEEKEEEPEEEVEEEVEV